MTVYPVGFELADVATGLAVLVDPARVVVSAEVVEAGATVGEEVVAVRFWVVPRASTEHQMQPDWMHDRPGR